MVAVDGNPDGGSGRFTLAINGAATRLDLASPLGITFARVTIDERGARLARSDGDGVREVHGASAEALTFEALGWPLPVAGFADWIAGRPVPGRPAHRFSGNAFEQDGWTITVLERFDHGAPRRLQIERPPVRGLTPAITLRLVLDS